MKVLHLNNVANVSKLLSKALNANGVESDVFDFYFPAAKGEFKRTLLKMLYSPYAIYQMLKYNKKLKNENFDIAHIHLAYLGLSGILGRYKYVLHCHGSDLYLNLYRKSLRGITLYALKRASVVLYSTPNLHKYLDDFNITAQYLPNPIDTELFKPLGENLPNKKVLINARIETIKGIDITFDVLKRVYEKDKNIQFYCFNWGSRVSECRYHKNLEVLPTVPYHEIPEIINRVNIVIGQFLLGALGMAELEAMSFAKPTICFYDKKYDAYSNKSCPVSTSRNPEEIAEMIIKLLEDEAFAKTIGQKGRDWVINNHSFDAVSNRLISIYKKIL